MRSGIANNSPTLASRASQSDLHRSKTNKNYKNQEFPQILSVDKGKTNGFSGLQRS